MDGIEVVLGGMTVTALIVLLVQFLKNYGLASNWIPVVGAVLGILFTVVGAMAAIYPDFGWWVNLVIQGFTVGLAAIGFHSANQHYQRTAEVKELKQQAEEEQTITTATVTATPQGVSKEVEVMPVAPTLTAGGTPPQGGTL